VTTGSGPATGELWTIDAAQCDPDLLRDRAVLGILFDAIVSLLGLHPVAPAIWHTFPHPGGVTGALMLGESHLTVHTFPEHRSACLDLFTCVPREKVESVLRDTLRVVVLASEITVQRHARRIADAVPSVA
jgi:S-adenosylmethionine decarboxylase